MSGYLASQGIATEGESSRAPEGTPEVVSLEDAPATAEGPSTEVAPTEPIAKGPAIPSQVEEPISRAESEPEISPLPVSSPGNHLPPSQIFSTSHSCLTVIEGYKQEHYQSLTLTSHSKIHTPDMHQSI